MKNLTIPDGLAGEDLFDFLIKNKQLLIAAKKSALKYADAVSSSGFYVTPKGDIIKGINEGTVPADATSMDASLIINTTFWYDSHGDVHIDGIWKKSLSEPKLLYLLQEHSLTFKGIISDEIKAYTKRIPWKELGVNFDGETQALVFDAKIEKSRNEFMFDEYRKGHVKNHSVGMRYVDIQLAINSEADFYKEEFALWNKYIAKIANQDAVQEAGYFWAVKEAGCVEGSAVPIGSNIITPTQSIKSDTSEKPVVTTSPEPSPEALNMKQLLQIF